MGIKFKLTFIFTLGVCFFTNAQDTLRLVNGKSKVVKIEYETSLYVFYHKIKNNDTTHLGKKKMIEKDEIFQIAYLYQPKIQNEKKVVQVYQQDSTEESYLSIDEMKRYLNGRSQAQKNYKGYVYGVVGFAGGAGSAYLGPFWGLIPGAIYTGVAGVWAIKPFFKADNQEDFNDPYFAEGFKQVALSKQAKYSAIGVGAGFIAGIAAFQLIFR